MMLGREEVGGSVGARNRGEEKVKEKPTVDWKLQQKRLFGAGERLKDEGVGGFFLFYSFQQLLINVFVCS